MALRNIFSKAASAASGAAKSAASTASKAASAIPRPTMPTMPADLAIEQHEAQDKAAKALRAARATYKRDGSTRKAIAAYEEHVRANATGAQWPAEEYIFLSQLYVKSGNIDEAWDYLNEVMVARGDLAEAVRGEQSRILRKEKRYEAALAMYCSQQYFAMARTHTFSEDEFVKGARVMGSKLGMGEPALRKLAKQVIRRAKTELKEPDFTKLVNEFLSKIAAK